MCEHLPACVSIFPQDQTEDGIKRLMRNPCVYKVLRKLKAPDSGSFGTPRDGRRTLHQVVFKFPTKGLAKRARDRILEEQGVWPTFAVVFGSPSIVQAMSLPVEDSTPGAAV